MHRLEAEIRESGYDLIAGVDEAGRGPLAGPVVAAAVILDPGKIPQGINDSKKLSPSARERLFYEIYSMAVAVGIGLIDSYHIDRMNILKASLCAMKIAVSNLSPQPDYLLIDGNKTLLSSIPQTAVVCGDATCFSIAAASIVAKVTRDRLMARYAEIYPGYGFEKHKGYPTKQHRELIRRLGPCPIHRMSFKGVVMAGAMSQMELF